MPPKGPKSGAKKGPPSAMLAKLKEKMAKQKEEEERLQREAEEEERRLREEEKLAEEQRKIEEQERLAEREERRQLEKENKKKAKQGNTGDALERMRNAGMILPDVEKIKAEAQAEAPQKPKPKPKAPVQHAPKKKPVEEVSDDEVSVVATESDEDIDEEDWEAMALRDERRDQRHRDNEKKRADHAEKRAAKIKERQAAEEAERAANHTVEKVIDLRSPICCVLGHVDAGKTSLLDRIRTTNVQGGEAGGITQQIGATFFPREALESATMDLNKKYNYSLNVPGMLVIDTPGHESFTNLRSRGSSLCDIAILVVDMMHGLEPQTKESIRLLRERKCPFIVALNKVDRLYDWVPNENMDFEQSLSKQKGYIKSEFETRLSNIKTQLSEQGLNSELYYKNKDQKRVVSIVPTSAKTGEGISDLLLLEIQLVQQFMEGKVTFKDDLQCTILEVKPIVGIGVTIDVVLINGVLNEGDEICVCGTNGPIFTQIRSLLTPQPLKELRVRGNYVHHKTIRAAMGIKIAAADLDHVIPGTPLLVVRPGDDREALGKEIMKDANNLLASIDKSGIGVTVQSSTLGSLEALLSFLKDMKVPVANVAIGPIYKRHVLQVLSMKLKAPRYAMILAFDVEIMDEARTMAEKEGITVFEAQVIYHLFDKFTKYMEDFDKSEKARMREVAVFPVQVEIIDDAIHKGDPMILPIRVTRGQLRVGTPLGVSRGEVVLPVGRVMSMERDGKTLENIKAGDMCAVKIHTSDTGITFGRQIEKSDALFSIVTRASVDAVKLFKDEFAEDDMNLLATLVKVCRVPPPSNRKPPVVAPVAAPTEESE